MHSITIWLIINAKHVIASISPSNQFAYSAANKTNPASSSPPFSIEKIGGATSVALCGIQILISALASPICHRSLSSAGIARAAYAKKKRARASLNANSRNAKYLRTSNALIKF
jgi:hypothetical protein